MATTTVLYPEGTKFNMEYYMSSHMPFVGKKLGPHGLKSWKVLEFPAGSPFCVQATLEWESQQKFETAGASPEMKEVLDDVPNFADKQPTLMPGTIKGTS
ncbi:hypothetical protein LTR78_004792 [Recurvomyces mirabilis]|uniref:EthD domain-containing protein n=1 Tax=Recurvomyces mirabilis TaxID=574656 RepID=A0AAE0WP29_9PEZI|nr:hypothetical protein LTR78_004792 [Recurvomyces mirabilis]KAK5157963.1 hypothetical protein LTS14_003886 [Recurvomyces mirabilis]